MRAADAGRYVASSMKSLRFFVPFLIFFVLTPIMLFLGLMSAGAGHGDYFLAKVLFPYTLLSTAVFDHIASPFIWVAGVQYPVYGLLMGLANIPRKLTLAGGVLAFVHALAVVGAFAFANPNFSGSFR